MSLKPPFVGLGVSFPKLGDKTTGQDHRTELLYSNSFSKEVHPVKDPCSIVKNKFLRAGPQEICKFFNESQRLCIPHSPCAESLHLIKFLRLRSD